jgi:hypothetical protein
LGGKSGLILGVSVLQIRHCTMPLPIHMSMQCIDKSIAASQLKKIISADGFVCRDMIKNIGIWPQLTQSKSASVNCLHNCSGKN